MAFSIGLTVVTKDDVNNPKPVGDPYQLALDTLDIKPTKPWQPKIPLPVSLQQAMPVLLCMRCRIISR